MDTAPNSDPLRALRKAEAADSLTDVVVDVLRSALAAAAMRAHNAREIHGRKSPHAVAAKAALDAIAAELDVREALAEAQRLHPLNLVARCVYLRNMGDHSGPPTLRDAYRRALARTRNGSPSA